MESIDVLGLPIEEALKKFKTIGILPQIVETKPLRGQTTDGVARVVRQEHSHNQWRITICNVPDDYR